MPGCFDIFQVIKNLMHPRDAPDLSVSEIRTRDQHALKHKNDKPLGH